MSKYLVLFLFFFSVFSYADEKKMQEQEQVQELKWEISDKIDKSKKQSIYSGKNISLKADDKEVKEVLRIIADSAGLNLVVSDSVSGNVTLRLKNVPWDQALGLIVRIKG